MDLAMADGYGPGMRRRSIYDPLEPISEPRWYVVRDSRLNRVLEARQLAQVNLKRIFVAAMLERIDAGWQLGEFSSRGGSFFCTRGVERCQVGIEGADPGQPIGYGAAHLCEAEQTEPVNP
jgi:hypothetical protein